MQHLVIGAGEVGQAIATVLKSKWDVTLRDMTGPEGIADVMHVCFPWSSAFEGHVRAYIDEYVPKLVIIHSTVPVGTSRRLDAVHSPVTGKHPNLAPSVQTFTKFFGGHRSLEAAQIFAACGVTTRAVPDQETTEAGKLWATLQYGWMIAIQKEAYRYFRSVGADPEVAYREFNRVYNAGYEALGEPFRLPILRDIPGKIGGHCVIPNAALTDSPLATELLDLNETY